MARLVKDVIATLSELDPNASCVWQLWTKDHIGEDLTAEEWESVVDYYDNHHSIESHEVGLDDLMREIREKRKGLWE